MLLSRFAASLVPLALITVACVDRSGPPPPAAYGNYGGAPTSINADDQAYCAADQNYRAHCSREQSSHCLENACTARAIYGSQLAYQINTCTLQRSCSASKDGCTTQILGSRANAPETLAVYNRCSPYEQRCGSKGVDTGNGKVWPCATVAMAAPALIGALDRCYDLPCDLARACTQSVFANALMGCGQR